MTDAWKILCVNVAAATACCWSLGLVGGLAAAAEPATAEYQLSIARQTLDVALQDLARQTGLQIMRFSDAVQGDTMVGPLDGRYSIGQALQKLLAPGGLTYRPLNARAYIVIVPPPPSEGGGGTAAESAEKSARPDRPGTDPAGPERDSKRIEPGAANGASGEDGKPREDNRIDSGARLEEIVVTAQKVEQRLRDIPMSITAITARELQTLGATGFLDFANTVPSLNFTTSGVGQTQINLRGITSGYNVSPTVGVYVDDVPYGSSTSFAASAQLTLDMGLFDMNRIEILRGPQGTLYGASTMGGLLKYVTNAPAMDVFGGSVRANVAGTRSGGVSYDASSTVNLPLGDGEAAARLGGFYSHHGGYVDNLARDDRNVDRAEVYGGRVDLLLMPDDRSSVRLVAFAQDIERDGSMAADVASATGRFVAGDLDQRRELAEPFGQRFRLLSATVNYSFDLATATSISSYQQVRSDVRTDFSPVYLPTLGGSPSEPFNAFGLAMHAATDKFTQEIRLAASGPALDWLIGGFYTVEDSEQTQVLSAYEPDGARANIDFLTLRMPSRYQEYAAFGNLTLHLTGRLDVTAGLRYAHNSQRQEQVATGRLIDAAPERSSADSVATYLATARYRVADDVMPYFRFATGYRPGGPNPVLNDLQGRPLAPPTFDADRLTSYEAGIKFGRSDRRLSADLALYRIDWDDMQILATRNGLGITANAARARSQGLELTVMALPLQELMLAGVLGYTDARLSDDAPDLGGVGGESLPDTPRISATLSADYRFGLHGREVRVGTTVRHVAGRNASFDRSVGMPQYELPSYTSVDLRAGMTLGAASVKLYCKNIGDRRGQLSALTGMAVAGGPIEVSILQPRTFGLSVDVTF